MNKSDVTFLRDLAERLRRVPVMYGVNDGDIDLLQDMADRVDRAINYTTPMPKS